MVSMIWLLVPTFTGTLVRVVQLAETREVLDCSRYGLDGLLVNGQVNTSEFGLEYAGFKGGYVSTIETLSSRMPLVTANPLVALMAWNERVGVVMVAIQLVLNCWYGSAVAECGKKGGSGGSFGLSP